MDDADQMFAWDDEALEDRCLDLQDKVRARRRELVNSNYVHHCMRDGSCPPGSRTLYGRWCFAYGMLLK